MRSMSKITQVPASTAELRPRLRGDRREHVDEVPVRIAEQERPVAPGHRGGLGDHLLEEAAQLLVRGVDVVHQVFDDHRAVGPRLGGPGAEQRHGAGAGDGQRARRGRQLGEDLVAPDRRGAGDLLVEGDESGDVVGDDADRDEFHGPDATSDTGRNPPGIAGRISPVARPTSRVLALLELLQSGGTRTVAELADRLGVDERTVRRYVGHLIDMDVPVESVRGRYGGYRLGAGYRVAPPVLRGGGGGGR